MDDKQFHVTKYEHAYELEDSDKKNIISVVGQGFAEEGDDGFSNLDAEVTRKLLKDTKSNKEIGVVKIMCTYKDPTTGKMMEALVGVMLLSSSTCLMVHDKVGESPYTGPKTFKVCNLVQICILPEFRQRGLGFIGITALKQQMIYLKVDFLWWCGTATKYYDKYLYKNLYKKNPKMMNCPFNLNQSEAENRNSFYYMEVTNKFQDDWAEWYNEDPENRYFTFQEPNEALREYHGCKKVKFDEAITHTFKEKLQLPHAFDFDSYRDECIFEITIEHKTAYKNFTIKLIDDSLVVHHLREGTMGNTHKYAKHFPLKHFPFKKDMTVYKLKLTSRYDGKNFDHKLKLTSRYGGKNFDYKLKLLSMYDGEKFVIAIEYSTC